MTPIMAHSLKVSLISFGSSSSFCYVAADYIGPPPKKNAQLTTRVHWLHFMLTANYSAKPSSPSLSGKNHASLQARVSARGCHRAPRPWLWEDGEKLKICFVQGYAHWTTGHLFGMTLLSNLLVCYNIVAISFFFFLLHFKIDPFSLLLLCCACREFLPCTRH